MSKLKVDPEAQASIRSSKKLREGIDSSPGPDVKRDVRLGYLVHDVSRLRRHAFDLLMKPFGITRSQWWVLGQLMRQDGMTQTQLATILDVGRASLGTVLDRLETGGLIRREVDSIDKRSNRVFLTKTAEKLIGKMIDQEKVFNELILKKVSPGDRDKAIEVLTSIKSALRDIVSDDAMV